MVKVGDPVFTEPLAVAFDKGGPDPTDMRRRPSTRSSRTCTPTGPSRRCPRSGSGSTDRDAGAVADAPPCARGRVADAASPPTMEPSMSSADRPDVPRARRPTTPAQVVERIARSRASDRRRFRLVVHRDLARARRRPRRRIVLTGGSTRLHRWSGRRSSSAASRSRSSCRSCRSSSRSSRDARLRWAACPECPDLRDRELLRLAGPRARR